MFGATFHLCRRSLTSESAGILSSSNGMRYFASSSLSLSASRDESTGNSSHVVRSPYRDIPSGPYPPMPEFVSQNWRSPHFREKAAVIDGTTGQTRTFSDYDTSMRSIGAYLRHEMSLGQNDTVVLFSPNHVDYLPIVLGIGMTGANVTPVNPLYKELELAAILGQSQPAVLIAHESNLDVAFAAARTSSFLGPIVCISQADNGDTLQGTVNFNDLKWNDKEPLRETLGNIHCETHPFIIPYSSGTTGLPKGVCLSHSNLVVNLLQTELIEGRAFSSDERLISPLPFFHIYGLVASSIYAARYGQTVITMSGRFKLEDFCELVETHSPHRAHLVPPIILGLAKNPVVDDYDMSSLKMILSAAAPLSGDIEREVRERLRCGVKQAWGMSELSPIGTLSSDENPRSGSVGNLVSSTFGKIVDPETGKNLGPGETGELFIKGPQVMMGYKDDPEKTAQCLTEDGWLRTGDIGYYDKDFYFFVTDRLKEMIKVRGFPVAPAEIESLLLTHDHVQDAAVIATNCERSGELPKAYIVLKRDVVVSSEEIHVWVNERVSPHKRLAGGICFTHEIPKSASGKILRRVLRDLDRATNNVQ